MNSSELATFLYPLGYLSALAFALRFFVQWYFSEAQKKSVVTRSFWWLSLAGNILLLGHSLIQMQFPVALVQSVNGVVSWRNLNLMQKKSEPKTFYFTLGLMLLAPLLVTTLFYFTSTTWFGTPSKNNDISFGWHLLGMLGVFLFSFRFIVQWWDIEKKKESRLGLAFWWMSLTGGLCSILYFSLIQDPVNLIGPLMGIVPYTRNLILMYKRNPETA